MGWGAQAMPANGWEQNAAASLAHPSISLCSGLSFPPSPLPKAMLLMNPLHPPPHSAPLQEVGCRRAWGTGLGDSPGGAVQIRQPHNRRPSLAAGQLVSPLAQGCLPILPCQERNCCFPQSAFAARAVWAQEIGIHESGTISLQSPLAFPFFSNKGINSFTGLGISGGQQQAVSNEPVTQLDLQTVSGILLG